MKCYAKNDWSPLKSVVLGSFMDPAIVRDVFDHTYFKEFLPIAQRLAVETEHDLNVIQQKLEDLGVHVIRPDREETSKRQLEESESIKLNLNPADGDIPSNIFMGTIPIPLSPRNEMMVYKDIIFCNDSNPVFINMNQFENKIVNADEMGWGYLHWPAITRVDDRLVFGNEFRLEMIEKIMEYVPESTYTATDIDGHVDASLACVKPGVLLTTQRNPEELYKDTFPGWHTINSGDSGFRHMCKQLTGDTHPYENILDAINKYTNNNWYIKGLEEHKNAKEISNVINTTLSNWFGISEETYFEVNCLTINPELSMVIGDSESIRKELSAVDHEIISVEWRNRWFFDQGLHCITQDLIRE